MNTFFNWREHILNVVQLASGTILFLKNEMFKPSKVLQKQIPGLIKESFL